MAYRRGGGGVTGRVDVWKAAWELNGPLVTGVLGTPPPAHTRGTGRWEKMRREQQTVWTWLHEAQRNEDLQKPGSCVIDKLRR